MTRPPMLLGALLLSLCGFRPLAAQGIAGSTMRLGSADTLFHAFTAFVRSGPFTLQRADTARREVVFLSKELTEERLVVRFVQRGDSTAVLGRGVDQGMIGTIASLDAVRRFFVALDSAKAPREPQGEPTPEVSAARAARPARGTAAGSGA